MKVYYIDDTFFKESLFLYQMRERLLMLCEKNNVSIIFVSGSELVGVSFEGFINICSEKGIHLICSPAEFDVQGVRGVLSTTSLTIDGFNCMQTYSGSVVCYDIPTQTCERIYLDFFPEYQKGLMKELIPDELEEILCDVIMNHNKHKNYN